MLISEILTKKQEKTLRQDLYHVIDRFRAGDYEFYLLIRKGIYKAFHNGNIINYPIIPFYQIAMNRLDRSFVNIKQQKTKEPRKIGIIPRREIKAKIDEWLLKYKRIYVGSMDERKNEAWIRILKMLGFKIGIDTAMGDFQKHYYIEIRGKKINKRVENFDELYNKDFDDPIRDISDLDPMKNKA